MYPLTNGNKLNYAFVYDVQLEKDRFRAMCFLLHSDKISYGELLDNSRKGLYKGRYEYPETITYNYELLIRTSRHIGMSTHQGKIFSSRKKGGGKYNFSFSNNGVRENIGRHNDQGNATAHVDVLPRKNEVIHDDIK